MKTVKPDLLLEQEQSIGLVKRNRGNIITLICLTLISLLFLYPLFLVFINSLKTYAQLLTDVFSLPVKVEWGNYPHAWALMDYPRAFLNTLYVTAVGIVGIIFISSLAGYKLARTKTRLSNFLFMLCIIPMLVPFHTIMIALTKVSRELYLIDSLTGLIVIYWGLGAPLAIFLYHGFVKSVPAELDEAAVMDGCTPFQVYSKIIFPLLKPITTTIVVLDVLWIWNDFLLPLLMVNGQQSTKTLQLRAYQFFGQYVSEWQYVMAAIVMSVVPVVIFFLIMQKQIIKGIVSGAVKG
jgi:raffinose/stachyose/melibiose transport system permease protein